MKGEKTMSKKVKNEVYYNVLELMEILKLPEEQILNKIKTGSLKEEHFVSKAEIKKSLDAEIKQKEIRERLEKRSEEGSRAFSERSAGLVQESSFRGQGKEKQNFKTWELKGL